MATYNLVRNAYFDSLTTSGTGNVSLTWAELEKLMDGNTTSSGIDVTSSGILFLETDLSQRIKVDEIRLYANDLGQAAYISFYYKNASGDSYTLLTTQSGSYYYATISDPSAPRYIRAVVSGVAITLYEFEVLNNDYIVAFGEDGAQYAEYLADTPIGETGTPQAVAIYNNGTGAMPADAYVCVDYTGETADNYVEISSSENGTYYGIDDGILIDDDQVASEYRWSMGTFSNTSVVANSVAISITRARVLGQLPMTYKDSALNVGSNAMAWDRINNKIYIIGMDGASTGPVRLYEYFPTSDTWLYLSDINPAYQAQDNLPVMSYCNVSGSRRIYCMTTATGTFGYYTLGGVAGNWTLCANPTWSYTPGVNDRISMCSDGTRYIYALTSAYGLHTTNRNFKCFDTVSGTWSTLSNLYLMNDYTSGGGSAYGNYTCLTYDYDRDCIYLHNNSELKSSYGDYIQKYYISLNIWDPNWAYVGAYTGTSDGGYSISYHNNYIYIGPLYSDLTTTNFYRFNINTASFETITYNYRYYNFGQGGPGISILAIDPLYTDTGFASTVYFTALGTTTTTLRSLYSYNASNIMGTYKSPIFELEESNNSSYFMIDGTAVSGAGSISYDEGSYNGTIRVRDSNTAPLSVEMVFNAYRGTNNYIYVGRWIPYTDTKGLWTTLGVDFSGDRYMRCMAYDKYTGNLSMSFCYVWYTIMGNVRFTTTNILTGSFSGYSQDQDASYYSTRMSYTNNNSIWVYGYFSSGYTATLRHLILGTGNNYVPSVLYSLNEGGLDFVRALTAEWAGNGVWYTHKSSNLLIHRNYLGTSLQSIVMQTAGPVCPTRDNGCWAVDNGALVARRYTFSGTLASTINLGRTATHMTTDFRDGFWYTSGLYVYHVTEAGIEDTVVLMPNNMDDIEGSHTGCFVYIASLYNVYFINYSTGTIAGTWSYDGQTYQVAAASIDVDDFIDLQLSGLFMPASYDPVWGTVSGSLAWQEVRKDGYFLPKTKYHQVEVTLRGNATLEKILMPPAIKIEDIQSQSYKNAYVRTVIPLSADITDYEARLKAWWGVNE